MKPACDGAESLQLHRAWTVSLHALVHSDRLAAAAMGDASYRSPLYLLAAPPQQPACRQAMSVPWFCILTVSGPFLAASALPRDASWLAWLLLPRTMRLGWANDMAKFFQFRINYSTYIRLAWAESHAGSKLKNPRKNHHRTKRAKKRCWAGSLTGHWEPLTILNGGVGENAWAESL